MNFCIFRIFKLWFTNAKLKIYNRIRKKLVFLFIQVKNSLYSKPQSRIYIDEIIKNSTNF